MKPINNASIGHSRYKRGGFSLIELLVVISIMALLFGFSYASYREFQRRQVLKQSANTLITDLRLAQQ